MIALSRELRPTDVLCRVCGERWAPVNNPICEECKCPNNALRSARFEVVRCRMQTAVTASTWATWLSEIHFHGMQEGVVILGCPTPIRDWVEDRFGKLITACIYADQGPENQCEWNLVACIR